MMTNMRRTAIGSALVLLASWAAYAQEQEESGRQGRGAPAIEAAQEALGLTEEQVDQIREIRRERPPRGQSRDELQAWREERQGKVEGVLNADQKAKLADMEQSLQQMQAFAGARALGLLEGGPRGPAARGMRGPGSRAGQSARRRGGRSGSGRGGKARADDRRPGRGRQGVRSGRRGSGSRWAPNRRGPGRGSINRGPRGRRNARAEAWGQPQARPGFQARRDASAPMPGPGPQRRGGRAQSGD